jgi:hypothetical protein
MPPREKTVRVLRIAIAAVSRFENSGPAFGQPASDRRRHARDERPQAG